jgi:ubiquinone/menaquinone biosynthesis C-methylase UbiE
MTSTMPWNTNASFPELYEQLLVQPLFQPYAEALLDRIGIQPDDRVLDVACGTGIVARLARRRLGRSGAVVGVDVNPQMLGVATSVEPSIEWRQGNAISLPLKEDETFSAVTCHQGLQFFPDKEMGAREMRRALRSGGRVAVATWRSLDETPFFAELRDVAQRHVGPVTDPRHGFGDARALESVLTAAGFREVHVETVSRTVRFADGDAILRMNSIAVVGMGEAGKGMDESQKAQAAEAIFHDSRSVGERFTDNGVLAFELKTNLATAVA